MNSFDSRPFPLFKTPIIFILLLEPTNMKSRRLIPTLAALSLALSPFTATAGTGENVSYSRSCCAKDRCPFWTRVLQAFDVDYPFNYCYDYDNPRPCPPYDRR
jgi:hypothetical protein